jgi:hypothetical protein
VLGSLDGKKSIFGIQHELPDFTFEDLGSFFSVKILKFFDADSDMGSGILSTLDPGSGMEKSRIQDPG